MTEKTQKPTKSKSIWQNKIFVVGVAILVLLICVYAATKSNSLHDYKGVPKRSVEAYREGLTAIENNDPEKALNAFFKAIEFDNTFADALARIGEVYFIVAKKHEGQKNKKLMESTLAESLNYTNKALAVDPNNGLAHFVAGLHANEQNNRDLAISEFEIAESNGANVFELHSMLGYLYNEKEQTAKSIEQYVLANQLRPSDEKTLFNLGELYFGLGNYSKATTYFSELLKYQPSVPNYKAKYAASLWKDGKIEQARSLMNQILESQGNEYSNYNTVAWTLIDNELDVEWGIKIAHASNEMKPNNLQSIDILGWGYYKLEDFAKAVNYLNQSMNLAPSDEVKNRLKLAKEKLDSVSSK